MKFIPATSEGLRKRFHELYTEFTRQGKHEHRNELVFLLDELLRQRGIDGEEYTILNNILAKSLGSGRAAEEEDDDGKEPADVEDHSVEDDKTEDEDKSPDEKIKTLIQSTVEYLMQHDKKELLELVNEFRKDIGDDFLDTVLELEELVDVYLLKEFLEKESIRIKIDKVRRELEASAAIPKSKQHRLKMLLDDIGQNRHRVQSILKRLAEAGGEEQLSFTLEQLAQEELLSEEQHLELAEALQTRICILHESSKTPKLDRGANSFLAFL